MKAVGIDPSLSSTGVCWSNTDTAAIKWPGRGVDRLAHVYRTIADWIDLGTLDVQTLVCIEGYSMGSARQQSHAHGLGELGGVMRLALHHGAIRFLDVPPACVKKYATGKGNANKDLVRDAARDRLGLPAGVSSDECDAAWLRQIGLALVAPHEAAPVPKSHLAALDKLDIGAALHGGETA